MECHRQKPSSQFLVVKKCELLCRQTPDITVKRRNQVRVLSSDFQWKLDKDFLSWRMGLLSLLLLFPYSSSPSPPLAPLSMDFLNLHKSMEPFNSLSAINLAFFFLRPRRCCFMLSCSHTMDVSKCKENYFFHFIQPWYFSIKPSPSFTKSHFPTATNKQPPTNSH